ncbi:MAG: shikimate kinase [Acidobacteria bacterium]|nr:shikimate kinase [Acidobacteriota bacterium]
MTLWLVGMMGSGKTTSGELAASRLGVPFRDTDEVVAERMGCSVAQLWGTFGEATFRDMEKVALSNLAGSDGIVATGGGVVLDEDNRRILSESQRVVWLEASPTVLEIRLDSTVDRPGLVSSEIRTADFLSELLDERLPLYTEVASHRISTDSIDADAVAKEIEDIWKA